MRMIVFFDLPVETSLDRKNYRKFRKFLIENGYIMIQYSVYAKIILNHSALQLQKNKVRQNIPKKGSVEILVVTEKQFNAIESYGKNRIEENPVSKVERILEL